MEWEECDRREILNKRYEKNIEKQKRIQERIEELQLKQELLKKEQEEMENIEILKEYRSNPISLDEFLAIMRNYQKEQKRERKKVQQLENNGDMEDMIDERSEEHTSELQSRQYLVCRLLLEKKKHQQFHPNLA